MRMFGNSLHSDRRNRLSHVMVGALLTLVLLVACGNQQTSVPEEGSDACTLCKFDG